MAKLLVINNCKECPNHTHEKTPGAGYAIDYICTAVPSIDNRKGRKIAGYVEMQSEEPKDGEFPSFCPLQSLN